MSADVNVKIVHMITDRAENIDRRIDRNARSRTFSQSRKVSSTDPKISSLSRRKFKRKFVIFLSLFAERLKTHIFGS